MMPSTKRTVAANTTTTANPMFQKGDLLAAQVITLETMKLRKHAATITMSSVTHRIMTASLTP
jgi:hypothetical protein